MKLAILGCFLFLTLNSCPARGQESLCPEHIETPGFPALARGARISGKVDMTLTINADGNVEDVKTTDETPAKGGHSVLEYSAVENIKKWTFSKPSHSPFTQKIVFDYEFSEKLPGTYDYPIVQVVFDLPDQVKISSNLPFVNTTTNNRKTKKN